MHAFKVKGEHTEFTINTPVEQSAEAQKEIARSLANLVADRKLMCDKCGSPLVKVVAQLMLDSENAMLDGTVTCGKCDHKGHYVYSADPKKIAGQRPD